MKNLLALGVAIAAIGVAPAFANVDPKIAEFCLKAQDFQGCVRSMSGKKPEETTTTIRQVQQQGANLTEGNSCPAQHIYSGGGYCQRVTCIKRGLFGRGHAEELAGKGISCKGGAELTWDNTHQPVRASISTKCPPHEPEIGYASTCAEAADKGYVKQLGIGIKFDDKGYIEEILGEEARRIRLRRGDIVVSINGNSFKAFKASPNKRWYEKAGEPFTITVRRDGDELVFRGNIEWVKVPVKYLFKAEDR